MRPADDHRAERVFGLILSVGAWATTIGLCVAIVVIVSLELRSFLPALGSIDAGIIAAAWKTLGLTLFYAISSSVLQVVLGLAAALAVHWTGRKGLRPLLVTAMLAPYATPPALIGLVYRFLFGRNGDVPQLALSWFGLPAETWYSLHPVAAASAASVWQFFPFSFLLIYTALTGTPSAQLKAARLDGAPFWTMTYKVVLLRIAPVLLAVFVLRFIFMLVKFDTPYIFTEAGLASRADVATVEIYGAFRGSTNFIAAGESLAAMAVFILAVIGAVAYAWIARSEGRGQSRRIA